jgi:hypothetical protein
MAPVRLTPPDTSAENERMSRLAFFCLTLSALACSDSVPTEPGNGTDPAAIASVNVTGPAEPLRVGETAQLSATVKNSEGVVVQGATLEWASSDDDVASVTASGLVTALAPGEATVQAKVGGRSGSLEIEVTAQPVPPLPPPPPAGSRGAIAYVQDDELRLIEPDGSGDRLVWALPDTLYRISSLSWRPDGGEIAFASDHEMAVSLYERDLYAIRPDGTGLRKLTNAPLHAELEGRPRGTVTVTVRNLTFDAGPYFVYVAGAEEPQSVIIAGGSSKRITFERVADLGEEIHQPAVVINGIHRWWNATTAADVRAGESVDAGSVSISVNPFEHFGADVPFWRADGSMLGFIGTPTCLLQRVPADPPLGPTFATLVDPEAWESVCAVDWSPTPGIADPLLLADARDYVSSGVTHIHRVAEGSSSRNTPLVSFDGYVQVVDLRWLPDGSGFMVARHDGLTDMDINLYEFAFATGTLRQVTDFEGEFVRSFSISPDGEHVAFERISGGDPYDLANLRSDLWVMRRDGTDARLLVPDARLPAW